MHSKHIFDKVIVAYLGRWVKLPVQNKWEEPRLTEAFKMVFYFRAPILAVIPRMHSKHIFDKVIVVFSIFGQMGQAT